jgi:sodium-coupled neutral amino acid transporter 11
MSDIIFSPLNTSSEYHENNVTTVTFNTPNPVNNEIVISDENVRGKSSVVIASFNFINSIVGAGIIGIPAAMEKCGFIFGIIMLLFVACLVYQSVLILIDCGLKTDKLDFEEVAETLLGRKGYYAALISMFLFSYGAQVAYLIIIGDTLPVVFHLFYPNNPLADRNITISILAIVIILPLCLLKDLGSLSWSSLLSIFADVGLVLIVLIVGIYIYMYIYIYIYVYTYKYVYIHIHIHTYIYIYIYI